MLSVDSVTKDAPRALTAPSLSIPNHSLRSLKHPCRIHPIRVPLLPRIAQKHMTKKKKPDASQFINRFITRPISDPSLCAPEHTKTIQYLYFFFFLHEEKIPSEEIQLISSTHHQATNGIMRIRTIKNGPPYPSIRLIPVFRITVQIP